MISKEAIKMRVYLFINLLLKGFKARVTDGIV